MCVGSRAVLARECRLVVRSVGEVAKITDQSTITDVVHRHTKTATGINMREIKTPFTL